MNYVKNNNLYIFDKKIHFLFKFYYSIENILKKRKEKGIINIAKHLNYNYM